MANIKISELPVATTVSDADVVVINQGSTTKQAARSLIKGAGTVTSVTGGTGLTGGTITGSGTLAVSYGTTAGTAAQGNDARLSDSRTPSGAAGGDLGGTYPNPTLNTVAVNKGGTGQTSYTDGQLLIGNSTGNTLTKATLTSGNGIAVTNGAGTISLAADFGSVATKVTEGGTTVLKAGDTMSGKLVINTAGASAPLNLGPNVNPTPALGDVWLASSNNALTWRGNNGATYPCASTVAINSFTAAQGISASTAGAVLGVTQTTGAGACIAATQNATGTGSGISVDLNNTSSTATAVRITNLGTGDCLRVEDSTTPDATPFAINATGRVGVGLTADSVAAVNLDSGGIKLNNAGATLSATISVGSGSPQGVVTANPGSLFLNLTGGANTTLYVKESGTATNTGWVAK